MGKSDGVWITSDEIEFVKGIGSFKEGATVFLRGIPESEQDAITVEIFTRKVRLLENYLEAMALRSDWGNLDADKIRQAARDELRKARMVLKG